MTYLVPVVGHVAAVVDLSHMVMGTGLETADFYRGIVTLSKYATLAYYGESPTTIALSKLEVFYNLPRNNVYLERHGGWIENKEDAEARQVDLFLEMEEITRNNLILLYRAHRSLDRGANNDFGERIYVYSNQYESNLEMMHQTEQEILKEHTGTRVAIPASLHSTPTTGPLSVEKRASKSGPRTTERRLRSFCCEGKT